jgi:hypothetical protein
LNSAHLMTYSPAARLLAAGALAELPADVTGGCAAHLRAAAGGQLWHAGGWCIVCRACRCCDTACEPGLLTPAFRTPGGLTSRNLCTLPGLTETH